MFADSLNSLLVWTTDYQWKSEAEGEGDDIVHLMPSDPRYVSGTYYIGVFGATREVKFRVVCTFAERDDERKMTRRVECLELGLTRTIYENTARGLFDRVRDYVTA